MLYMRTYEHANRTHIAETKTANPVLVYDDITGLIIPAPQVEVWADDELYIKSCSPSVGAFTAKCLVGLMNTDNR